MSGHLTFEVKENRKALGAERPYIEKCEQMRKGWQDGPLRSLQRQFSNRCKSGHGIRPGCRVALPDSRKGRPPREKARVKGLGGPSARARAAESVPEGEQAGGPKYNANTGQSAEALVRRKPMSGAMEEPTPLGSEDGLGCRS
jgi:hypothetical protein